MHEHDIGIFSPILQLFLFVLTWFSGEDDLIV
jgi:hypothetical protein